MQEFLVLYIWKLWIMISTRIFQKYLTEMEQMLSFKNVEISVIWILPTKIGKSSRKGEK